jgi:hypothetical protein
MYVPSSPKSLRLTQEQVQSFDCTTVTNVPQTECEALVALYESTDGSSWDNNAYWLKTTNISIWYGVVLDSGHVSMLFLQENHLNGTIPSNLGNLTHLTHLFLYNNQLNGNIPPELGNLTNLKKLRIQSNQLSGAIPPELDNLTNLTVLHLGNNQLSGTIPARFGNLRNLTELDLGSNQLNGNIPPELQNLTNLKELSMQSNQLSGTIPPELQNLTNLKELSMQSNQLSGTIPPELGNLTNLMFIYLNNNNLSGAIPLTFTQLVNLHRFYFSDTFLCEPTTPEFLDWKATVVDWHSTEIVCDETVVDNAFRPNPDGYGFKNYYESNFSDFDNSDIRRMFGDDAVCRKKWGSWYFYYKPIIRFFYKWDQKRNLEFGHCLGMSVSSLRFYSQIDTPQNSTNVYSLEKDSFVNINWLHENFLTTVRKNIAFFHIMQYTNPMAKIIKESRERTPSDFLEDLILFMTNSVDDYPVILMYGDGKIGHVVTPYRIEKIDEGIFRIKIYNSDFPGDINREILVNTNENTWSYNEKFHGDINSKTIGFLPISIFAERPKCPWCDNINNSTPQMTLHYDGIGDFLITDSEGNRLGFYNGAYYEDIPDAFGNPIIGNFDKRPSYYYYLPLSDEYVLTIDGSSTATVEAGSIVSFVPGHAVEISEINVGPSTFDTIVISSNGTAITYQPNKNQYVNVGFYLDTDSASWQLQTGMLYAAAGKQSLITVNSAQKVLKVDNLHNTTGEYNLFFERVSDDGVTFYSHSNVSFSGAANHTIHFDSWNETGSTQLDIDFDGDGIPDEVLNLENQMKYIYLPLILN